MSALAQRITRPLVPPAAAGLLSVGLLLVADGPLAPLVAWMLMGVTAGYALSGSV